MHGIAARPICLAAITDCTEVALVDAVAAVAVREGAARRSREVASVPVD